MEKMLKQNLLLLSYEMDKRTLIHIITLDIFFPLRLKIHKASMCAFCCIFFSFSRVSFPIICQAGDERVAPANRRGAARHQPQSVYDTDGGVGVEGVFAAQTQEKNKQVSKVMEKISELETNVLITRVAG